MGYEDKDKQREYQRNWMKERRQKWLADRQCVVCEAKEDLEVDHIDPSLKTSHRIWSWSETRIEEELKKCQVLCVDCHRQKTGEWRAAKARPLDRLHGTFTGYTKFKCRCGRCRGYKRLAHAREKKRSV